MEQNPVYTPLILHEKSFARRFREHLTIGNIILYILLLSVAYIMVVPFLWMLSSSFKHNVDIFVYPIQWIPENVRWANYERVWTDIPFPRYYLNTLKLASIITLIQLVTCSFAAYSFTKLRYPGRDKLFIAYLATLMVPWHAIMIPQFIIVRQFGFYDSHMSLILIQSFNAFGVFILRQNMLSIPSELSQSAKIDGCSAFGIYARIIMPLTKTGLATLTIFTFNAIWNDYMGPLLYLESENLRTIQLGLATFQREFSMDYNLIMAGTVCSLIPVLIVYIFAQKYIIEGVAFAGLKG